MSLAKPYELSKWAVVEAYKKVKANKGAAGVDGQTIKEFDEDLKNNLYKIWNRMSSGSYFPPAVKVVEIPKGDGKTRKLGIPTVSDRVAQMIVKSHLEPELEKYFHPDSYGYRPNKSAHDALGSARSRCWKFDWAIDLDIKGFFDNLDHELVMRAVRKHTDSKWVLLYIERWLKAPAQLNDGTLIEREIGTPQGGVISPLLANLYLHYVFDTWLAKHYPSNPFERYADDAVVHCASEQEALQLKEAIAARMNECKLELHPGKTKIVYCKDDDRQGDYRTIQFDFLGYTFRPRKVMLRSGKVFTGFNPAISNKAATKIRQSIKSWKISRWSDKSLADFSCMYRAKIRGWINYYGRYYKSALYPVFQHLDVQLMKWAMRKYKSLRHSRVKGVLPATQYEFT